MIDGLMFIASAVPHRKAGKAKAGKIKAGKVEATKKPQGARKQRSCLVCGNNFVYQGRIFGLLCDTCDLESCDDVFAGCG